MPLTGSQIIHIASLILAGVVVVLGIYDEPMAATAVGVGIGVLSSIGAYIGVPATPSTPVHP